MRISLTNYPVSAALSQPAARLPEQPAAASATDHVPASARDPVDAQKIHTPVEAKPVSWARMSFDVDLSDRSIKVTLSDRNSGEVYRELVYDRGGLLRARTRPEPGKWIDRFV